MSQVKLKEDFMNLFPKLRKSVNSILQRNVAKIRPHLCLSHFITNRLSISTRKKKQKPKKTPQPRQYFMLNIYSDKAKKILFLFRTKGKQKVNPFNYLNLHCYVKMALIIEKIFVSKTVTSLQIKVHESYNNNNK